MRTLRLLLILVAVCAIPIWIVATSKTFQTCVQSHHGEPANQNLEKGVAKFTSSLGLYRDCTGEFIENNGEGVLASFTIILALSTIFLWIATRDLVLEAKATSERQLRAYLGIESVTFKNISDGEKPEINAVLKNFGQTPAYNIKKFVEIVVGSPISTEFPEKPGERQVTMNPGDGTRSIANKDDPLTSVEFDGIKNDTMRLYFYGIVHFIDAFDKKRFVRFRFHTRGERLFATGKLAISQQGNETSED